MNPPAFLFMFCFFQVADLLADTTTSVAPHPPVAPDTPDIRDIKEIIPLADGYPLLYWLGGCVALLLMLTALFLYLKKHRHSKRQQGLQAHEKAYTALESVRSLMTPEQSREFAIAMADILRQYIEDRFQLSVQNQTTREFLRRLTANQDILPIPLDQHQEMLDNWMNHCDLVKFAGYRLTEKDMKQMYSSVTGFIFATRPKDEQS